MIKFDNKEKYNKYLDELIEKFHIQIYIITLDYKDAIYMIDEMLSTINDSQIDWQKCFELNYQETMSILKEFGDLIHIYGIIENEKVLNLVMNDHKLFFENFLKQRSK